MNISLHSLLTFTDKLMAVQWVDKSVTFSDICMVKMENEAVAPLKPKLSRRYVDNIFNRRKKILKNCWRYSFKRVNNYHQNIWLTIEINSANFIIHKIEYANGIKRHWYTRRQQNCQYIGHLKSPNVTKAMSVLVILTEEKEYRQISWQKLLLS